jgi:outer membrane protein assembly factor BamB
VALDKLTGRTIWTTTGLDECSAYSSPILIQRGGNRLLVNAIQKSIICVNVEDGMLYCYDENTGDVALVKTSPKSFEIVSSLLTIDN